MKKDKRQLRKVLKKKGAEYLKGKNMVMQWHIWAGKASLDALETTIDVFRFLSMGMVDEAIEKIGKSKKQEDLVASLTAACFIYKDEEFRKRWNETFPEAGKDFPGRVMVNSGLAISSPSGS